MSAALESLLEMGFPRNKAERALEATGNQGAQQAMEWLLSHLDEEDEGSVASGSSLTSAQQTPDQTVDQTQLQQPKSLKCEECGKLFKSGRDAEAHAARTQHQNFSESTEEIKPLTAEEKAAQLKKLEERMKQRRQEREEKEKEEVIEREKIRRKGGKDITDLKQKMELQEAKKIAEERRREKQEDRLAKQRVREQIARDRAEHKARQEEQKAAASLPTQPSTTTANTPTTKKEYTTCKLQIRLLGGGAIVHEFAASTKLEEVQRFVESQSTTSSEGSCTLMTSFPKHVFTREEADKTLQQLGLVPSAVIIQTKATL